MRYILYLPLIFFIMGCAYTPPEYQPEYGYYSYKPPEKPQAGIKVYDESQCIGPVIMGVCEGSIINKGLHKTCYGEWLNGQCIGPMF